MIGATWKTTTTLVVLMLAVVVVEAQKDATNCGLKCFRWKKCMSQLDGGENRPGQLGNTGQLVLNTCDIGDCDCAEEERKKSEDKIKKTAPAVVVVVEEEEEVIKKGYPKTNSRIPGGRTRVPLGKAAAAAVPVAEAKEEVVVEEKPKNRRRNHVSTLRLGHRGDVSSTAEVEVVALGEELPENALPAPAATPRVRPERRRFYRQRY